MKVLHDMANRTVHTLPDFFKREVSGMNPGDDCICLPLDKEYDLRQIVLDYCVPMIGAEKYFPDLFGKYGYTFTGVGDGWQWNFAALQEASEADLWKMLAIASTYWYLTYERLYDNERRR